MVSKIQAIDLKSVLHETYQRNTSFVAGVSAQDGYPSNRNNKHVLRATSNSVLFKQPAHQQPSVGKNRPNRGNLLKSVLS